MSTILPPALDRFLHGLHPASKALSAGSYHDEKLGEIPAILVRSAVGQTFVWAENGRKRALNNNFPDDRYEPLFPFA